MVLLQRIFFTDLWNRCQRKKTSLRLHGIVNIRKQTKTNSVQSSLKSHLLWVGLYVELVVQRHGTYNGQCTVQAACTVQCTVYAVYSAEGTLFNAMCNLFPFCHLCSANCGMVPFLHCVLHNTMRCAECVLYCAFCNFNVHWHVHIAVQQVNVQFEACRLWS